MKMISIKKYKLQSKNYLFCLTMTNIINKTNVKKNLTFAKIIFFLKQDWSKELQM